MDILLHTHIRLPKPTHRNQRHYVQMASIHYSDVHIRICMGFGELHYVRVVYGRYHKIEDQSALVINYRIESCSDYFGAGPVFITLGWSSYCAECSLESWLRQIPTPNYSQSQTLSELYTYALSQSLTNPSIWYFGIQSIDSPEIQPSTSLFPTISNVTYNFTDYTFFGNCSLTPPSSPPSNSSLSGSNSSNSIGSDYLKAVNDRWTFSAYAPSVVLLDDTDGSGEEVLTPDRGDEAE